MTTTARALASLVIALCLLGLSVSPSLAQDRPEPDPTALQVSLDGITWRESITTPLFDPDVRWVPGDERTARFFVRNTRRDGGDLRVVLQRPEREALLDTGFLAIAARAGNGPWVEVASGGRHVLVDSGNLDPRSRTSVQLRATMDPEAPNRTMVLATDLDLDITLTQAGVVADADSDNGSGNGDDDGDGIVGSDSGEAGDSGDGGDPTAVADAEGFLPDTGSELRPWVLPLALLLLGGGAVLMARRRSDEDEPDDEPRPPQDSSPDLEDRPAGTLKPGAYGQVNASHRPLTETKPQETP